MGVTGHSWKKTGLYQIPKGIYVPVIASQARANVWTKDENRAWIASCARNDGGLRF